MEHCACKVLAHARRFTLNVRVEIKRNTRVTGLWCTRRASAALDVSSLALYKTVRLCVSKPVRFSSVEVAASVRQGPEYSSLASYKQIDLP